MTEKDKVCQVAMWDGASCGRELYDDEYCIFHSRKPDKDGGLFQKKLDDIFKEESFKIYDFSNFIFPEEISFPYVIDKKIIFRNATFSGFILFYDTIFQKEADFEGTTFQGRTQFYAIFQKEANFTRAAFQHDAYFMGKAFKSTARFVKATFSRKADFTGVDFQDAHFSDAVFKKDASFTATTFNEVSEFCGVTFEGKVTFEAAIFKDALLLNEERKKNRVFSNKEVNFRYTRFLRPEEVIFRKVDLGKFRFIDTDLRKVEFISVDWYKEKGRNKIYDEVSPDPETKKFDYSLIAQVYKRLRANYEKNLNYAEAGDFHIGEMEMRRKGEKNIYNKAVIWLYKLISNYGESFWRPLGWIALLILIFPFLYMLVGITPSYNIDINQNFETLRDYGSSLTYSLSVFSLVRERPYHTINNLGHFFTILESIFSPVLIAFFLLALRRRFKR